MFYKTNHFFDQYKAYGAIFIRLLLGFHLIYGVQDNVLSWERMLEFKTNMFPALVMLLGSGFLFFHGSGKLSFDNYKKAN